MAGISTTVHRRGPLFDRNVEAAIRDLADQLTDEVGSKAFAEVHDRLDQSLRNPTPYYETQIIQERVREDVVVHDRGIIYGPWLEGVGSRNRTTRFKGYSSFRRATQAVEGRVPSIVRPIVNRWVARMGG